MSKIQRLCRTKQKQDIRPIYGFDIETYDDNKKFFCGSVVGDNLVKTFFSKSDLINFFKTKRFKNSVIAATNLQFDFNATFFNEPEAKHFKPLWRGSDILSMTTYSQNKDFCIRKTKGKKSERIDFIDTMNYARLSVDNLGKILSLPKLIKPDFLGNKPSNEVQVAELVDYNVRDAEISKKIIDFLYKTFHNLGATPKLTIASTAMSLYKNRFIKDSVYYTNREECLLEQFKAYYGGRCEAFTRGRIENFNYYDINSLYPSVMVNCFPDPNSVRVRRSASLEYIYEYEGISNIDIYCPEMEYPLLPYRNENKVYFPTGIFSGWYTHIELRKALELGYKVLKIRRTYWYKKSCSPFKDYVESLYELRNKFKSENNKMELVVKLLLNSLYGKFGQKFVNKDAWIHSSATKAELSKYDKIERYGDYFRTVINKTKPSAFCIPIWACYVTSMARLKLYEYITRCDPVYCDTDSIITKKELITSNKLGGMKLEMKIKHGLIVKPKFYSISSSKESFVKIKGLGRRLKREEFLSLMNNPSVTYKKFMKFKESVKRGFIPNQIVNITKNFNLEDDKRTWKEPFNFNDIQVSKPSILDQKDFISMWDNYKRESIHRILDNRKCIIK